MSDTIKNPKLNELLETVRPYRERLMQHSLYAAVNSEARLCRFMETHVFAVWDFMSLLKSLQRSLTCVEVPWLPTRDSNAARLINEIVLGEETDEYLNGSYASHLQIYIDAMNECGADTRRISGFCDVLRRGHSVEEALQIVAASDVASLFVNSTMSMIQRGQLSEIAAAFVFGREDPIPDMFERLLATVGQQSPERFSRLSYYLQRHIALDSTDHGPKALQLLVGICGKSQSDWQQAKVGAVRALLARERLWDGLLVELSATL